MEKQFNTQKNIGKSKYILNFHNGEKRHKDGSIFFDIAIFSNKMLYNKFKSELIKKGFKEIN